MRRPWSRMAHGRRSSASVESTASAPRMFASRHRCDAIVMNIGARLAKPRVTTFPSRSMQRLCQGASDLAMKNIEWNELTDAQKIERLQGGFLWLLDMLKDAHASLWKIVGVPMPIQNTRAFDEIREVLGGEARERIDREAEESLDRFRAMMAASAPPAPAPASKPFSKKCVNCGWECVADSEVCLPCGASFPV